MPQFVSKNLCLTLFILRISKLSSKSLMRMEMEKLISKNSRMRLGLKKQTQVRHPKSCSRKLTLISKRRHVSRYRFSRPDRTLLKPCLSYSRTRSDREVLVVSSGSSVSSTSWTTTRAEHWLKTNSSRRAKISRLESVKKMCQPYSKFSIETKTAPWTMENSC